MKKQHVTKHTDEARPGLVSADPGHAPGKHHINVEAIAAPLPGNDPHEYGRRIPVNNTNVRRKRMLRGR